MLADEEPACDLIQGQGLSQVVPDIVQDCLLYTSRSGAIDVVVVDSVAALVPRAEIEGDMGDSHVGLLARLMSQALRCV